MSLVSWRVGRAASQHTIPTEDWTWDDQAGDPCPPRDRGCGLLREEVCDMWEGGPLREYVAGEG